MMNIAERTQANAPAEAQGWLARFETALQAQDAAAAAALFTAGRHVARPSGLHLEHRNRVRPARDRRRMLRATLARSQAVAISTSRPQRTPPRWVARAGTEAIECLFDFDTAFGPCSGVVRLVRDEQDPARLSPGP